MPPRKKDAPSSSSTSSSNSSSSSTSSSSSSGSDSSSSDSENTSTSGGGKSGQPSSDSDKKPTPKKKTASATVTRSKSDASEPDKSKDKPKSTKPLVNTTHKPVSTTNKGDASSSDSEDESPKVNSKRKPQAKPKSSATVTPVAKGQNKTTTRQGSTSTSNVKKVNPPRKVAQKSTSSSAGSSGGLTSKESSSKATSGPKLDDQKKLKTKSIFSPDNTSEDSDDKATPPPPKLTAIKSSASKNTHNKTKTKPSPPAKTRASSVSSNSSDSSRSSRSSSDSSPDSSRTKTDNSSSAANRKSNQLKKDKKSTAPPKLESDTDTPIRKQTRSSSTRKSKHVISRIGSDSDSDTGTRTSASKSPAKKVGPKGPPCLLRKPKSGGPGEYNQHIEFEERSCCPLAGCDSIGHLSGKYEKHYILEACPRYHNMTPQQCKDALIERTKREEERKKAQLSLKIGQVLAPTAEQRMYREKVKEMRSKHATREEVNSVGDSDSKDRQTDLSRWSNKYDVKLFQEAQAVASEAIEEELRQLANVNCTKYIEMGKFEMEVWYQSPYPEDYARLPKLYICEYCLRYMKSRTTLDRHSAKCVWRHPPGEEVYRKEKISVWEVDGKRYKPYCQNLCLLAKFFLDHKTLYYDVEPFLFYVMTISDSEGCHIVGYFSKEKNSFLNYNVSCILTLPPYQRQGYGRLLIEFSYLLTRVENKIGSPEKPLSDLGLISYRSYWKDVLLEYLCNLGGKQISVKDISQEMAINSYDIVSTLQALGMMKYWKGKHIILKKQDVIDEYVDRSKRRGVSYKEIDPQCLKWSPYVPPDTPPGPN